MKVEHIIEKKPLVPRLRIAGTIALILAYIFLIPCLMLYMANEKLTYGTHLFRFILILMLFAWLLGCIWSDYEEEYVDVIEHEVKGR